MGNDILSFVKTCDKFPEQYEVFDESGACLGYIRVRWGHCWAYDTNDNEIYVASINGNGCFVNEEERLKHLLQIKDALLLKLKKNHDI